ncbi:hypothetical protein CYLTODRAFT_389592 [Cylindrobasidium torrendii FP15055 ss-10]|uniref:ELMO domain-containing protein n=1 Tax=Cylindrobasidium torrendii FP15055 ss-10 TaxID=1314674 RepID=A0A0D7BNW1_9AGAR|nr:hypothetical protein CYLTODRAFT_389592 [Cylindrobasidium torrendii FP15055 ss-10]
MSVHRSPSSASPRNPSTAARPALVPTNSVTTPEGITVRARIDPTLTVNDVVKQLCVNLKLKTPPSDHALRDEADELVTNENMRKKIKAKVNLKLVNAPAKEAREIIEALITRDDKTLRLTLFSLQKYIREPEFARHFVERGGLDDLVEVIHAAHGNTLAYALIAMQNLMDLDYGWSNLDSSFTLKVVQILSSPQSLINVCRPATAILKKLVEADPTNAPIQGASSSTGSPQLPHGSVHRYGFSFVFEQMRKEETFLQTVVNRLGSADTAMVQHSMMLINSLLSHVGESYWDEFVAETERLHVRKAVARLMATQTVDDLTSCILDFQANIIRVTHRKKTTQIDSLSHETTLKYIWSNSKLEEDYDEESNIVKWRKLGFTSEDIEAEFRDVGVLGLDCLKSFVKREPDFPKLALEQLSRAEQRRCPIGRASNEVVELLSEHWAIFAPGYSTSTTFQPFFMDFERVHSLATQCFIRMWGESNAATDDFTRVAALVRSQVKVALRTENARAWHEVEHDFLECEYRSVRERQMREIEMEDDLLSKVPIRNLRAKIYKESYEFVREQRIHCLFQGAWFVNAYSHSSPIPKDTSRRPSKPWRFLRLDNSLKHLYFVDSPMKFPVRSGLDDLPERIEVAAITEIATGTCIPPPNVLRENSDLPQVIPSGPSPLSFSLLSAHDGSMSDLIAPDQSRWADWTDGLNMLRRDSGHVASKETAGFVQALTEIGLKIKLLDLSGEKVEIPSGLSAGPPPPNTDFFFSDL